jgi:hypothetical protein
MLAEPPRVVEPVALPVAPVALPVEPAVLPVAPVALPVAPVALPVEPVALPVAPLPVAEPEADALAETFVRMKSPPVALEPVDRVVDDAAPDVLLAPELDALPGWRQPVTVIVCPPARLAPPVEPCCPAVPAPDCADTATANAAAHTVPRIN